MRQLIHAIKGNNIAALASLVENIENEVNANTSSRTTTTISASVVAIANANAILYSSAPLVTFDAEGRSLLALAILSLAPVNVDAVRILLTAFANLPKSKRSSLPVDINAVDAESGYSPMHLSLHSGFLRVALVILQLCPDVDLSIRCKDGNTCFDLLDFSIDRPSVSTIQETFTKKKSEDDDTDDGKSDKGDSKTDVKFSTSVWTWGSNSNFQLGHSNENNRAFPERVDIATHSNIKSLISFNSLENHNIKISAVGLSKYHSVIVTDTHLYSFGFGSGGRLGLGHEDAALLPSLVRGLPKVNCVSVGPDHSVAVSEKGEVFTWGSNKWGQLGYVTDLVGDIYRPSFRPNEVTGNLKKEKIIGVAAAKYHTVAFSVDGLLFTWGWNIGQLGYNQIANSSQLQQTPRKVTSLPYGVIVQVSATNNATAILMSRGEIYVFANYEIKRVVIQNAIKIVSGNHQFVAITKEGDVYMWSPPVEIEEFKASWQQINFPQTKPKRIWEARRAFLVARDVAVGIDSTVIIATDCGHVYSGTRRKEVKIKESRNGKDAIYFKFRQLPHLHNVKLVSASISGAFAAVRFDQLPDPVVVSSSTLRENFRKTLPPQNNEETEGDSFYDVKLSAAFDGIEYIFKAHRIILCARSPFFNRMLEKVSTSFSKSKHFENEAISIDVIDSVETANRPVFIVRLNSNFSPNALSSALELIYSGSFSRNWEHLPKSNIGNLLNNSAVKIPTSTARQINPYVKNQTDFYAIVRLFELDQISALSGTSLARFQTSFEPCLSDPFMRSISDIVLELEDEGQLLCHQVILAARSPFFEAMLSGESQWMLRREKNLVSGSVVAVDLSHISKEVMEIVINWIYTDAEIDIVVKNLQRPTLSEYMGILIDILSAANELLLGRLKEQISRVLCELMALTNVVELLEVADIYDAGQLKKSCLEFLCWNLSTFLESRTLESVPENLIIDIENALQEMQRKKFPYLRGLDGFYAKTRAIVNQIMTDEKNFRNSVVAREDRAKALAEIAKSRAALNAERIRFRAAKKLEPVSTPLTIRGENTAPTKNSDERIWKYDECLDDSLLKKSDTPITPNFAWKNSAKNTTDATVIPKPSLTDIMRIESTKSTTSTGELKLAKKVSTLPVDKNTQNITSSPSSSISQIQSSSPAKKMTPPAITAAAPIFSPTLSPSVPPVISASTVVTNIQIKTSSKKSQKERKRESGVLPATPTASITKMIMPVKSSSPWNIPQQLSGSQSQNWTENPVSTVDFWGASTSPTPNNGSVSKCGSFKKELSITSRNSKNLTNQHTGTSPVGKIITNSSSSPSAVSILPRPSLADILQEEMNRQKNEQNLRETIKKTTFAEIQQQELERKELKELYGVDMVLRNGEWELERIRADSPNGQLLKNGSVRYNKDKRKGKKGLTTE
ncbi:hypothetical protein HK100_002753 [Physocladia obscura]|uniref:BTB domain-containing protein n=1 Tax=Physocladia obscura TaxID=109957 RepID=A0AAD5XJY0_9FUNG|nr:hypothetical protein HK100_002753 [Physocladia obscura]